MPTKEKYPMSLADTINKNTKWVTLRNNKMFRFIFGEDKNIKYTLNLIKCVFKFTDKELKGAILYNGEVLNPKTKDNKTYITDVIVELVDETKVVIEMQSFNNKKSTIKHELYGDRIMSSQLKEGYDYDNIHKVYQVVIIGYNQYIKEINNNHILLEPYIKTSVKDREHKLIEEYRKTFWLDIGSEEDYTKYESELISWVKLFRANSLEETKEVVKGNKLFEGVLEEMKKFNSNYFEREYYEDLGYMEYVEKRAKEYGKNEGLEQGLEQGIAKRNVEIARYNIPISMDI